MTSNNRKGIGGAIACITVGILLAIATITTDAASVHNTIWSLLPPVIAIILALATKEVYSALLAGIISGGILYAGFDLEGSITHVYHDGLVAVLADPYNIGILIFLVLLGIIVSLMNRSGGSSAFGHWAQKHIKNRVSAQLATIALGVVIFIDDYFNCLTVGGVMRPVADKFRISRAKFAYLIDATAAPVCILAPISSWAAAVSGFVPGETNGLALFLKCIPYNFYALFTIIFMIAITVTKNDFGLMKRHEENAMAGDLFSTPERPYAHGEEGRVREDGKMIDMLMPVISLITFCVIGMVWSGGFFKGVEFIKAFSESDASIGLPIGAFFSLIFTMVFYISRKVMRFQDFIACVPAGFISMIAPILILTFAWTLKSMTDSLGAAVYVSGIIANSASVLVDFLPVMIFLIGCFLAFATGTSWGTFGILIPIVVSAFQQTDPELMIISMSACIAGAVCGDHCSPISDTTIMASAGAHCYLINHVKTQLPYAMTVAGVSAISFVLAGITRQLFVSWSVGLMLIIGILVFLNKRQDRP